MTKRLLSIALAICLVLTLMPATALAVEYADINDIQITEANATRIQGQFGAGIAEVTSDGTKITIKLLKNITGRIEIHASGSYVFDANGHTISGGTQNEAIGMGWNKKVTLELVGNGTYNSGIYNTLVVNDNTLIIKSATINGKLKNRGTLNFALQDGSSYFTVKNNGINLFDEKNIITKAQISDITGTGTGIVVAQYSKEHDISLDTTGTHTFPIATVSY